MVDVCVIVEEGCVCVCDVHVCATGVYVCVTVHVRVMYMCVYMCV